MSDTTEVVHPPEVEEDAGVPSPAIARPSSGLGAVVERRRAVQGAQLAAENDAGKIRRDREGEQMKTQPLSVVVIDDEPDQVDLTVLLLQSRRHRAVGSMDGSRAVALVTSEDATVVVLDFTLNGMTGGDVCSMLRADPQTRPVRIVLLSGTPEVEIRRSCTQYDVYLRKPTTSRALFRAVETVVG